MRNNFKGGGSKKPKLPKRGGGTLQGKSCVIGRGGNSNFERVPKKVRGRVVWGGS